MDCSALRTRGSPLDAEPIHWDKVVSMRLIKREEGSRVTPLLSMEDEGRRSGQWERASGPASNFLGIWTILRSKSERSSSQHAWCQFNAWDC